jgi:pimeloyl-ACP methyl ester carboxylesterase
MQRRNFIATVMATGTSLVVPNALFAQSEAGTATPTAEGDEMPDTASETGHAPVNGLQMYYEIHGRGGVPVLLLHGAFSNIETDFSQILPALAQSRQVIAVEQQAHGRTADIDRPLSYEQMADDTAALLQHLGVGPVDVVAYSFGSGVALNLAVNHPELVRKLVLIGGIAYHPDGLYSEVSAGGESMTAEQLAGALTGTPWQEAYARLAPNPDDWLTLVEKKMALDAAWQGWSPEMIQSITAPTMIMIGDSDIVRPEHTVELFRLFGGGVPGDLTGLPRSWLAILPGTTHVTIVWENTDRLVGMIEDFLAAPMPEDV